MNEGRITEQGSHDELMAIPEGDYRHFVDLHTGGVLIGALNAVKHDRYHCHRTSIIDECRQDSLYELLNRAHHAENWGNPSKPVCFTEFFASQITNTRYYEDIAKGERHTHE